MNKTNLLLTMPALLGAGVLAVSQPTRAHEAEKKAAGHHEMAGMKGRTNTTKLAFSSQPSAIPVGKAATWTLKITDAKSGKPVSDFEVEMTKLMHLIVVKNDLSWFNHIHPIYKGNGTFVVTPTLPSAGTYKLYADYTRESQGQEVPQLQIATGGAQPTSASAHLTADKMQGMWLKKNVNSHPEGQPGAKGGAIYQVAMMPMPMPLKAGQATMLHFQIRDAKGRPIKDLQPYLGAMGHCVILSSDTKSYLHSHPMEGGEMGGMKHDMGKMDMSHMNHSTPKSGGPDVMFHTNFPRPGLYKAWGQFQHKGKIITAAFVMNAAPASAKQTRPGHTIAGVVYTCPMHPKVQSGKPGACPQCGMALVKKS